MFSKLFKRLGQAESPAPPWGLGTALLMIVIATLTMIIGTFITLSLQPNAPHALILGWTLGGIVTVIYTLSSLRQHRDTLRLDGNYTRLYLVLLFSIGMALLIDTINLISGPATTVSAELSLLAGTQPGVFAIFVAAIFMLVVQPLSEELIFRGVLFPAARQVMGGWLGWLVSGAASGVFHLVMYTSTESVTQGFIFPMLMGLTLGMIRAYTHSTRAAIVAHAGFGLFALLKLLAFPTL